MLIKLNHACTINEVWQSLNVRLLYSIISQIRQSHFAYFLSNQARLRDDIAKSNSSRVAVCGKLIIYFLTKRVFKRTALIFFLRPKPESEKKLPFPLWV